MPSNILDSIREFFSSFGSQDSQPNPENVSLLSRSAQLAAGESNFIPNNPFKVTPTQSAEAIKPANFVGPPEPTDPLHPSNVRATTLTLGALAKGAFEFPLQVLQIGAPYLDLRETPLVKLFPEIVEKPEAMLSGPNGELGVTPNPLSVAARGFEVLGFPQAWAKGGELAKQNPFKNKVYNFGRQAVLTAGEWTGVSPLLDSAFGLGIDPNRVTPSQRYAAFPAALLQVAALGSGVFGKIRAKFPETLPGKPIVPLAEVVKAEQKRLTLLPDMGGEITPKSFGLGDNIISDAGVGKIVGETTKGFKILVDGKEHTVPRSQARRAFDAADSKAFDIEKIWAEVENLSKIENGEYGPTAPRISVSNNALRSLINTASPAEAAKAASELLSNQELSTLGVMKQYTTTLDRSIDRKSYALELMNKTPGLTLEAAMKTSDARVRRFLDIIEASGTEAGKNLQTFSNMKDFFEAKKRLSKDIAEQMRQVNKNAMIGGWMDRYKNLDNLIRGAAVSGFRTLTRNIGTQFGRGMVQAIEHGIQDSTVAMVEVLKGSGLLGDEHSVSPKFLNKDGSVDFSRIFADTTSDIVTLGKEASDIWDASRALALDESTGGELSRWSNEAYRAVVKGKKAPPMPNRFTGRFSEWEAVSELAPIEMDELLNSPTGETPITQLYNPVIRARLVKTFQGIFEKDRQPIPGANQLGPLIDEFLPALADYGVSKATALNSLSEIWQRRLFATARMDAHARRNGMTLPEFMKEATKRQADRSIEFDKALYDTVGYATESTWAGRRHGRSVQQVLKLFDTFRPLHQLVHMYPNYTVNRMAFLSERMPHRILGMLNPEFTRKLAGEVTTADVIADLKRDFYKQKNDRGEYINKGKKFKPPDANTLESMMPGIRVEAQRQAADAASKVAVGLAALGLGSYLIHSKLAGSRYNQFKDPNVLDENGRPTEFDTRAWDVFALPMGLNKIIDSLQTGKPLRESFSLDDMTEILTGIRRVDDTALGVFQLPQLLENGDTEEVFTDFAAKLAGSAVGRIMILFRNSKDLAGLADLRVYPFEGADELTIPDQGIDPFLGPALSGLPRGFQRSLLGEPIPGLNSPFKSEHLHSEYPMYAWMTGVNLKSKTPLEDLMDTTSLKTSDVIGRQPSHEMAQIVAGELGKYFNTPVPTAPNDPRSKIPGGQQTFGDFFADLILDSEAALRRKGLPVNSEFRKERLREIFASSREAVMPQVLLTILKTNDPDLILRTLGKIEYDKLSGYEKTILEGGFK